mgnify:FL=1
MLRAMPFATIALMKTQHRNGRSARTSSSTRNASTKPRVSTPMGNASARSHTSPSTRNASTRSRSTHPQQRPRRNASARKPIVILVFALALIVVGVSACNATSALLNGSSQEETSRSANTKQPYVSPYDFSGLSQQNGRFSYSENGIGKSQTGIDVSEMQGTIDWKQVANDGIQFAFVRIGYRGTTEGGLFADARLDENLAGAASAGLQTGVYFYSQATSVEEAQEEADFVLSQLDGRKLDLPITFDHEKDTTVNARGNNVDRDTLTAAALAFCQRVEQAGYRSMVYGNKVDIARMNLDSLGNRPIWFAEYNALQPSGQFDFVLWQYSNTGSVAGISAPVDINLRFTDML